MGKKKVKKPSTAVTAAGKSSAPACSNSDVHPPANLQQISQPDETSGTMCSKAFNDTDIKKTEKSKQPESLTNDRRPKAVVDGEHDKSNILEEKSREEIMAERKAKKEAKAAKKSTESKPLPDKSKEGGKVGNQKPTKGAAPSKKKNDEKVALEMKEQHDQSIVATDQSASTSHHAALESFLTDIKEGQLCGVDNICTSFSDAFKEVIMSYSFEHGKSFVREFEFDVDKYVKSVSSRVPLPVGLRNLIRQLKHFIHSLPDETKESLGKEKLVDFLDGFIEEQINLASKAISLAFQEKLRKSGDRKHILTYGRPYLVETVLCDAHAAELNFELLVVDSFPNQPMKAMLPSMVERGIECSYVLLSALNFAIHEADVILIEADGVLGNGNILAPLGTCSVCLAAKWNNIPVLVLSQTYKFCERLVTGTVDPLTSTLGNPSSTVEVVPAGLISGIITELRILPCSSAPAVVKAKILP